MATVVQCPNPSCARVTRLGEDSLGRIFRCPRCLSKLPTAVAQGTDSGWTTVLGPMPRRFTAERPGGAPAPLPVSDARPLPPRALQGFESGEFYVRPFDSNGHPSWNAGFGARLTPAESGDVCIGPLDLESPSEWDDSADARPRSQESSAALKEAVGRGGMSRFQILELLGEGRHAAVYRAFDPLLERQVALKVPRREAARSLRALERFLGEARALARLRHPRIVPIYEAGRDGDRYYIAMALIEGHSLSEALARGLISFERGAEITAELAEALAYAHDLGIVHRDVKPANIRIDAQGAAYLMDFGIAYRPDSGEVPTPPGVLLGTPAYVAPEQAKGGQADVLPASDQYSLGAVLYELLCGRPPFHGPPSYVLFHAIHHDPPSPRTVAPKVPRALAAICQKALAKSPDWRYPSCRALAADLRRWLRGESPRAGRRLWSLS